MTSTSETHETPRRGRKGKHEGASGSATESDVVTNEEPAGENAELAPEDVSMASPEPSPSAEPSEASSAEPSEASSAEPSEPSEASSAEMAPAERHADADPEAERRRIREQLEALERKQAELRRALAVADHPGLAEAIRAVEGRVYAVARVEAKMAQGLSKSEERRRETLEKKLAASRNKLEELNRQIAEIERELHTLGALRTEAFEAERRDAIEKLMNALSAHGAAFDTAGLELTSLVPELARFIPEVRALAEEIVARGPS